MEDDMLKKLRQERGLTHEQLAKELLVSYNNNHVTYESKLIQK